MIVCLCRGVTERHVEAVVADGAATVAQVTQACGAGGDCGACRRMVAALVEATGRAACAAGSRT